jgi:hypothetical protein
MLNYQKIILILLNNKKKKSDSEYGNRTRLSAMKTPHTNRYTNSDFHEKYVFERQNY